MGAHTTTSLPLPGSSPISILPTEVLALVLVHLRALFPTPRLRQRASTRFALTSRAFQHARLAAPAPDELAVAGAGGVSAAVQVVRSGAGRLKGKLVRTLEVEVTQDEVGGVVELLGLVSGGLFELELAIVGRQRAHRGGRQTAEVLEHSMAELVRALCRCTKLDRVTLSGPDSMTVLTVLELEECLHHWPLLTHLEYDQLGLDLPIYNTPLGLPPPLASLTLPSLLHTLAIQSIHTDSATLLFASLVRASSATLTHVILANAHIEPGDELAPILLPAAASLTTIEYHLIQRTPFSLAAALRALPRLKHLIVPVDILRTKVVLAALTAKAADPAHAWLESVTLGPEEYPAINARAPKVMPARRLRLLELAKVVPTGKVRIGSETIKGADGFADELGRRGIELEVVEQSEIGRDREGRRDRWVWH